AAAHALVTPTKQADLQRDGARGVGPVLDRVTQRFFQRCGALLHGLGRIAGRIPRLTVKILGCARGLLDLAFHLALDVTGHASKAFFQLAADISGGADHAILIHGHVLCIGSIVQQSSGDLVQAPKGYGRNGLSASGAAALPHRQRQPRGNGVEKGESEDPGRGPGRSNAEALRDATPDSRKPAARPGYCRLMAAFSNCDRQRGLSWDILDARQDAIRALFGIAARHRLIASPMQAPRSSAVGLLTLAGAAVGSAHRSRASPANGAVRILIMTVSLGRKLRH